MSLYTLMVSSRLTYNARFIPQMADHWQKTAPAGADTRGWRY
jgi:hypothetical protein